MVRRFTVGEKSANIWRRKERSEFTWRHCLATHRILSPLDQGCWQHLKDVEMANLPCRDMEELHLEFDLAVGRLRQKPHLIQSFFAAAGLSL